VRRHPGYLEGAALENDIAVIQLGTQLPYPTVEPAVAGDEALYPADTMATTIGWGDRDIRLNTQYYPLYLREVEVPVVDDETCEMAYPGEIVTEQSVCAGDMVDGGEDTCYGDSGGPLMIPQDDEWLQIGITSTGRGCARRPYPGVYTEVSAYTDFVTRYLDPDEVPDRVTNMHRRPVTATSVRISWTPPFFDGGTAITQYRIDVPDLGRAHAVVGTQHHFRLRRLPPGDHLVTVRAVNVVGGGAARSIVVHVGAQA
jgi:secreted trypsin-like serine protease